MAVNVNEAIGSYLWEDFKKLDLGRKSLEEIFNLFPGLRGLYSGICEERAKAVRSGVTPRYDAETVFRAALQHLARKNIEAKAKEWARELTRIFFEFETNEDLNGTLKKIRGGDKEAALLLARTVYPLPPDTLYLALQEIKERYREDAVFKLELERTLDETKRRGEPRSRKLRQSREKLQIKSKGTSKERRTLSRDRMFQVFCWIKKNESWLSKSDVTQYDAWDQLCTDFKDELDLPEFDAFRQMLLRMGIKRPKGKKKGRRTPSHVKAEDFFRDTMTEIVAGELK